MQDFIIQLNGLSFRASQFSHVNIETYKDSNTNKIKVYYYLHILHHNNTYYNIKKEDYDFIMDCMEKNGMKVWNIDKRSEYLHDSFRDNILNSSNPLELDPSYEDGY